MIPGSARALQEAASVASILIATEAMIAEKSKDKSSAMPGGMGGGMGAGWISKSRGTSGAGPAASQLPRVRDLPSLHWSDGLAYAKQPLTPVATPGFFSGSKSFQTC